MSERPKIVLLVLGGLVTLVTLIALTAGAAVLGATRESGYVTTPLVHYTTPAYALVSETVDLSGTADAFGWMRTYGESGTVRVRVRSESGKPVFVGIAAAADVRDFLSGVPYAILRGGRAAAADRSGAKAPARPGDRRFWETAASGPATQTLVWTVRPGRWALVVMNADATPLVDASIATGFRAAWLTALARVLAAAGAIGLLAGLLLIVYGGMIPSDITPPPNAAPLPIAIEAHLTEPLNRWLWLVKWLLALPHAVILFFLWIAFAVLTVAAFFAILITGRYPAPLFATTVGIVRWNWRVGFYAYSALGTDRYPPFSLRDADYPARLAVAYPPQLSRGLALVKWWLLAIPHYLVIGIFSGTWWSADGSTGGGAVHSRGGLLPLLVLFAGIALAFTGRYPRGLFDLIVGLHRWVLRVVTYAALMHDAYPPFRVDLGGEEPGPRGLQTIPAS